MEAVNISIFRANLLKYLKKAQQGEQVIITSNGEVLATLSAPVDQRERARSELKKLAKSAQIHDIISPIDAQWDAAS